LGGALGVPRSSTRAASGASAASPPGDQTHCFERLDLTLQSRSVTTAPVSIAATASAGSSSA